MNPQSRKFTYTTPRHYRAVYFVESDISPLVLTGIIHSNLKVWGGRYNPIIPFRKGEIDVDYLPLLKRLDPDTIFYSNKVDPEKIKNLRVFSPLQYEKMDERGHPTSGGVDYHYLLDESNRDFLPGSEKLPILHIQGSYNIDIKAKSFYQTNFALFDLYAGQEKLIRGLDVLEITKNNHNDINKIITQRWPYFKSILSQLKINACLFRPTDFSLTDRFEIIVSDPAAGNEDLFYFWNRQQFIEQNRRLYQLIISRDDLKTLWDDPAFEQILTGFQIHSTLYLTSRSIPDKEMDALKSEIQGRFKRIRFEVVKRHTFPYEILDFRYHNQLSGEKRKQIFGKEKDLLRLTPPKLSDRLLVRGGIVYDIEVEFNLAGESPESKLKFPLSYPLYKSRINALHDQSIFVAADAPAVDFSVASNFEIFQNRLLHLRNNKESSDETGIYLVRYSSAGQKLFALFELFQNNWSHITSLIQDKFWLDILRFSSDFKSDDSNIPKGKGIFSHKDIVKERKLLYVKYRDIMEKKWKEDAPEEDFEKMLNRAVDQDMEDISRDLQDLVDIGAVFMGTKIKCHTCGSNKWYPLRELQDKMECKGCGSVIIPRIESPFYYRVNEIIVNNLNSDHTGKSKDFDGNFVVLRALMYLKSHSHNGFICCCPLDYAERYKSEAQWRGDVDILALSDGKFIIGEAKTNAGEFTSDVIRSLIRLVEMVRPDALMVAYNEGELSKEKLERIETALRESNCELILYKVSEAWYHYGQLFGLPKS